MDGVYLQCLSTEEGAVLRKCFSVKLLLVLTNILSILMKVDGRAFLSRVNK